MLPEFEKENPHIMKRVTILISLLLLGLTVTGFSNDNENKKSTTTTTPLIINFIEGNQYSTVLDFEETTATIENMNIPFVGNSFTGFKEAIAFKESQGKYYAVNTLGYLGKYQFGENTLALLRIYNTDYFLNNPQLQEDAFLALCSLNKYYLQKDIKRSAGKVINGIKITESGILAAAHLAGPGNVKRYLRSGGNRITKDAYGSSVQHYLKRFSGYDTSFIKANSKPKV